MCNSNDSVVNLQRNTQKMSTKTSILRPSFLLRQTGENSEVYVSEDIAILHSLEPLKHTSSADMLHTPQYVELGRIVLVTRGKATHQINLLHAHQSDDNPAKLSRGQHILQQFLDALGRKDPLPRNIKAYADHLCITPNHLSAVIREQSGRSVMDWLNAHCILRAQVLLRHTDLSIYEIADSLGFQSATFFTRFFHRETGITPKNYRSGKVGKTDK